MNKKSGFTLVELLAVISILGVIMVLFMPSIMNLYNKSKKNIRSLEESTLIDSAKMYAIDLDSGNAFYTAPENININKHEYKVGDKVSTYDMRVFLIEKGLDVPISFLVKNEYYDDVGCNYENENNNCKVNKDCIIHIKILGEKILDNQYYQTKDYQATLGDSCLK